MGEICCCIFILRWEVLVPPAAAAELLSQTLSPSWTLPELVRTDTNPAVRAVSTLVEVSNVFNFAHPGPGRIGTEPPAAAAGGHLDQIRQII